MTELVPRRTTSHPITPGFIDDDAYKVLRRLQQFGHEAYLVGGGVRDLCLGIRPKDFDVATSARPAEVRKLFRNCRLIGRRFRLAHILFGGGKVIEVATFRAQPPEIETGELITDDNEFGTPESDARRRDFTVNALFYDQHTNEIIDYVGGLDDLQNRVLRCIGEPEIRFREDPVRMLRAVKFAARLGFRIRDADREAILAERCELRKAAVPRLLEEILRMLWGGASARSFELLEELGLLELLIPEISAYLARGADDPWKPLRDLLRAVDQRCEGRASMSGGVLLAALYWPVFSELVEQLPRRARARELRDIAEALVGPMAVRLRVPRRDVATLLAVLEGQYRFDDVKRRRSARAAFARSPHFPALLDFFDLRARAEGLPDSVVKEWHELAAEHPPSPHRDRDRGGRGRPPRRRPPRRR